MFVPQSHGGLELDMPAALEIFRALGRIDGSVGWTAMIGGGCDMFASLLPRDTYEQVYRNGPDVIIAGSAQPVGTAEAVAGGWRVNGPRVIIVIHVDYVYNLVSQTTSSLWAIHKSTKSKPISASCAPLPNVSGRKALMVWPLPI
jgi:alkylation response protein AidB-like acyl-CoA dehydrogenase